MAEVTGNYRVAKVKFVQGRNLYKEYVPANAHVNVMAYVDGEWSAIKSVVNNGDGTVTCIFEDICPVAFVVNETSNEAAPDGTVQDGPYTGDVAGQHAWMWLVVMAVCVVGITVLLVVKRRKIV